MDLLRRWWVKKYKLPWTHECAQAATLEELLVEYYEDHYDEFPEEARKEMSDDGEFYFTDSGDALIDKWERELQKGLTPDLEEGLSNDTKENLKKEREHINKAKLAAQALGQPLRKPSFNPQLGNRHISPGRSEVLGRAPADDGWVDLLGDD